MHNALTILAITLTTFVTMGAEPATAPAPGDRSFRDRLTQITAAEQPEKRFDISFRGGTIDELVATLEAKAGTKVNIMVPVDFLKTMRIPPFDLSSVDTKTVFTALNLVMGRSAQFARWVPVNNVWVLEQQRDEPRRTQVFYVGQLLTKFKVEDITTAIKTAWQLEDGDRQKADLKFHQDTQLLIVLADGQHLALLNDVLNQLRAAIDPTSVQNAGVKPENKQSQANPKR